jgi:glycosyltransferase involved in cell wall biosynthesis
MKVAILCPVFLTSQGVCRVVERQAKDFAENGDDVTIFCLRANMVPPQNVKLEILGMPDGFLAEKLYRLLFPLALTQTVRARRKLSGFDVAYSHEYPLHWLAYMAKRKYRVKYICYYHHLNPPEILPTLLERTYSRLRFTVERWLIKKADGAISVSEYSRRLLREQTGKDSTVIYNRIDTGRFRAGVDSHKVREEYKLGDSPTVLYVGQVSPTKSVHLLLEAFRAVNLRIPRAKLLIVGSHPYKDYSRKLMETRSDSIIFVGEIADNELPYYYAACDVYATASLWEGFNLPLAEAQACGKPVVAFDIGPHPEVVKGPEAGKLVLAGDVGAMAEAIVVLLMKRGAGA